MNHYLTYDQRLDMITTTAWESWTGNGCRMDAEMQFETEKTVRDAAINVYVENITDIDWLQATFKRIGYVDAA